MGVHCPPPYLMCWWTQCYNTGHRLCKRNWEVSTGAEGRSDTAVTFNADDGLVASTDPAWLQVSFNKLDRIFDRVVLRTNVGKTAGMVCRPFWTAGIQL